MAIEAKPLPQPVLFEADRLPTANDDYATIGATPFSQWTYDGRRWVCQSADAGAAVWQEMALSPAVQPYSVLLANIAALVDNGALVLNAGTPAVRGIFNGDTGELLTKTEADALYVAGGAFQPLDDGLTALAGLTYGGAAAVVGHVGTDTFASIPVGASEGGAILDRDAADGRYIQPGDDAAHAYQGAAVNASGTITLTSADAYALVIVTGTTPTITLPDTAGLAEGWWVRFKNRSGGTITPTRSGSNTVNGGGTGANIANNASLTFVVRSDGNWETT